MPGGDGKGPFWKANMGRGGGRMGGAKAGAGPVGECLCPKCGTRTAHLRGIPCSNVNCSKCGTKMTRA